MLWVNGHATHVMDNGSIYSKKYVLHTATSFIVFSSRSILKPKYFHTFNRNFAGAGEIFAFALVSAILLACLTGPWHRCPEKAFVKSIRVIGEPTDGVTLVEKSCIMQLLHAVFSARGNIVRINSCTDDTIRVSLTVAIRFTDASVNRYTPNYNSKVSSCNTSVTTGINSSPPGQNGDIFADGIFSCIFLNENDNILIQISLKMFSGVQLTINQHWFK